MTIADGWPTAAWASDAARVDDAALPPVLHPLLAARWSPTTFDLSYEVTAAEVDAILEAARGAPRQITPRLYRPSRLDAQIRSTPDLPAI
jgi:hypothetical protein